MLTESGPPADAPCLDGAGGLDAYASSGALRYPVAKSRFRGAGGTSNLWTGTCPRLHPLDFEPNSYTPAGAAWPIRYDALERYYLRAEEELHVRGVSDTPAAPPRSAPFPRPLPVSIPNLQRLTHDAGGAIALQQMPWSDWHGRPVQIAVTHLPRFSASPHGRLLCDATATRILCDDGGRVTGIELRALGQPPRIARARVYVIACGGIETARLLLLSRTARFADGIGNHADLVGRCFMEHPVVVTGRGAASGLWNPWSLRERALSEPFLAEGKRQGLGGVRLRWLATRDGLGLDVSAPRQSLERGIRAVRQLDVELKTEIEMAPSSENRVTLDDTIRDAFGNPGARVRLQFSDNDRRTMRHAEELTRRALEQVGAEHVSVAPRAPIWNHHHIGTCRMGDNPATSVVDRDLRVHDVDNLYVAGSAPFVTSGVSNPTLTIVALSLRLGDHLLSRLRGD
jgi:choline dehydrogenase-like flavoprotein